MLVIIPNYMRTAQDVAMLTRCLTALRRHEPSVPVLIADDGSPLADRYRVLTDIAARFDAAYTASEENLGYSPTINRGLRRAIEWRHDLVCTLNSDVEVSTPFVSSVTPVLMDGFAHIVGGRLLFPTGRVQSAGFEIKPHGYPLEYFKHKHVSTVPESGRARFVMGVTGAMQFFNPRLSYYNERYRMSYEDVDFCLHAWSRNERVLYMPSVEAVHHESATRAKFPGVRELESVDTFLGEVRKFNFDLIIDRINRANEML